MNIPTAKIASEYTSTYFVLDFDRCIGDTEKVHAILEELIQRETVITAQQLAIAKQVAEGAGQSFDTVDYVRSMLAGAHSSKSWQEIQQLFIAEAQKLDTLEPGARDLLKILDNNHLPYGIITYGGEAWQLAKLEAAGLINIPHVVTRIKEKGRILAGWKHDEVFIVPPAMTRDFTPLQVESIVFLDDKVVSFQDIPEGVRGVHVKSVTHEALPSQKGELPGTVTSVEGIAGAAELLFGP